MKRTFITLFSFICWISLYSQLTVNSGLPAQTLANIMAGYNIAVTNATVTGNSLQRGSFQFTGTGLGVNSGVILSSGNVLDAPGPNSSGSTSTSFGGPGNPLLDNLAGFSTFDACVLQFEFEVQSDQIEFKYIFLSEEYNEWVNTGFNDVFGFYISGPGITGEENLALVPGTTTPVSINTINNANFWQFYNDNTAGGTNIEYDGFTTLMTAKKTGLIPCEIYTLKLMIADGSDYVMDASVLLQENSLVQANVSATANTFSANDTALEGCVNASFTFQLDSAMNYNTSIPLTIGGTAVNGVDYAHIDPLIIIPAGQTSATIIIDAIADGITEGQETIELYFSAGPCQDLDTIRLFIDDYNLIEFTSTPADAACNGSSDGSVTFNISGGIPPYYITLVDSATGTSQNYTTSTITGLSAGTFYAHVLDGYGCAAQDLVFGSSYSGGAVFLPDGNGASYSTSLNISGFSAGQTLTDINQLQSICMNVEHSFIGDLRIELQAPDGTLIELKHQPGGSKTNMGEPVATGPNDTQSSNLTPGVGYDYCFTPNPTYGTMNSESNTYNYTYVSTIGTTLTDSYLPAGSYQSQQPLSNLIGVPLNGLWTLIITDDIPNNNGYVFSWSISLVAEPPDSVFSVSEPVMTNVTSAETQPGCGQSNGSINITVSGTAAPYSYVWSNGSSTQDISGISSGTYIVSITGTDNCEYVFPFNLSSNGTLSLSGITTPSLCPGQNNGSVDLSVTGGTIPLTYQWSNGPVTQDISGLSPGTYTITVNDASGCMGIESYIVTQLPQVSLSGAVTNENCGDHEGIIDLTVSGGSGIYSYAWSNGVTTQDITDLIQGNYSVTVTDTNNCSSVQTFVVTNYVGNCIPNCDMQITNSLINNEICGNTGGSIDITVFTSFSPYSVQWSGGQVTDDIYFLNAGTYTVSLTDAQSCLLTTSFTITNQTGTLAVPVVNTEDETCGNNTGSVDITVTGGAMPYSYLWSNGSVLQDITGIHEGNYSVTVTDANGCQIISGGQVSNLTGTLVQTFGNAVNEVCGNSQGSIDIQISGGTLPYSYIWSNGAISQDLINITAGNYSCTITDMSGCKLYTPVYVVTNESGTLSQGFTDLDNEICNNGSGAINISVSGGVIPYSYSWSNGATSQDLSGLSSGLFSCTVSDAAGCLLYTPEYSIINESGTLSLDNIVVTDELCSNNNGEVNLTVTGGNPPVTYLWNTGVVSEDLMNLGGGNYACTVTDNNGCSLTLQTTVNNNQGTLQVLNTIMTPETCGQSNGQVDIITGGGTTPYSFIWNNGSITEDLVNINGGNYTLTITDAQNCQIVHNVTLPNNTGNLLLQNAAITNEICSDQQGAVDLTVSGTQIPFTYLWTNGATSQDIAGLAAGIYSCTVTDNINCSLVAGPYTVNNSAPGMNIFLISITDENCGNSSGAIDINVTGGTSPFTYLWSNTASTQDISGLSAGSYTVTVTDVNSCNVIKNYVIINNSGGLTLSGTIVTDEVCSNGSGSVNISPSGGTPPYTYLWSNGAITQDITGISGGNYSVTVYDASSCSLGSVTYIVSNNPGSFAVTGILVTDENCHDSTGSVNISITGAVLPVSYSWSNGAFTQDITGLPAGNYFCTATDNNGCQLTISSVVSNEPGTLASSVTGVTHETCLDNNGSVSISVTGGTLPYYFTWNNGSATEDISGIPAGTYTCVIVDSAGCEIQQSAIVNNIGGDLLISNYVITPEHCSNQSGGVNISVTGGTGPYSYLWSNSSTQQDVINLVSGLYSVSVSDINGCLTIGNFLISDDNGGLVMNSVNITDDYCMAGQGAIDINYSGGALPVSVLWNNNSANEDLINIGAGEYSVTVTDSQGCILTDTVNVYNITNGLAISNAVVTDDYCGSSAGAIDLTVTGGNMPYTFIWSDSSVSEDLSGVQAGNYSCTLTDVTGCQMNYVTQIINNTNGLAIQNIVISDDYCNNFTGNINLTITGGSTPYSFQWSDSSTAEDILNAGAGTYSVTITDASACIMNASYVVGNENNPNLGFLSVTVTNDNCGSGQGMIQFTPTGNYLYELNGHPGGTPVHQFTNLVTGIYVLSVIDGNCRHNDTVFVDNNSAFNSSVGVTGNEYCGAGDGFIDISVTPSGIYSYNWSNGTYNEDINNIPAGTYTCDISDTAGCHDFISATIVNIADFSVSDVVTDETCGQFNGAADLTVTGISGPAGFLWSNGMTTEDISGINAGSYSCTVTSITGCSVIQNVTVMNNTGNLYVSSGITDDFCSGNQGAIVLSITGSAGSYNIIWNTGAVTDSLPDLAAGIYSVTVTGIPGGCVFTDSYTVGNSGFFTVSEYITHATCSGCNDGAVDLTINGAGSNYTCQWSNGATTQDISNLAPGTYSVTITDEWGCILTETYEVGYFTMQVSQNLQTLIVFPNPNNGKFIIRTDNQGIKNYTIELFDVCGSKAGSFKPLKGSGDIPVNLQGQKPGIYLLKINDGNNVFIQKICIEPSD